MATTSNTVQTVNSTSRAMTSYEMMTGRSLPTGVTSVVQDQPGTYVTGGYSSYTTTITVPGEEELNKGPSDYTRDAFAMLDALFRSYGLESLSTTMKDLMTKGFSAEEAATKIKYDTSINPSTGQAYNAPYMKRFSGNQARISQGLNAYSEAEYLNVEQSYEETLRAYGLGNLISTNREENWAKFGTYIANDIAPTEFRDRIALVTDRVTNMDPKIADTFKTYYPSLTKTDLVSYFLDPKETLPVLKNKVTSAEIGTVAAGAGLGIDEARAMDLAKFGISRDQAIAGYSAIGEVLPVAKNLSDIYAEEKIGYTQQIAEDEYLKQDAQAKLKRNRLASKERASFSGDAGVNSGSLVMKTQGAF